MHLYWRCHNREFYLKDHNVKDLYMKCIKDGLEYKDQGENCLVHAFCAMGNHFHLSVTYKNGSKSLSNFMRYTHGIFGARYNRKNDRSGKVAEGRPKTPRVQDDYHAMRLQFYIEANPIRAGFCTIDNLKDYIYSSFGFYAYGIRNEFTYLLTIPEWYRRLGKNYQERQKKYRKLFHKYLEKETPAITSHFLTKAIGDELWLEEYSAEIKARLLNLRCLTLAGPEPNNTG